MELKGHSKLRDLAPDKNKEPKTSTQPKRRVLVSAPTPRKPQLLEGDVRFRETIVSPWTHSLGPGSGLSQIY